MERVRAHEIVSRELLMDEPAMGLSPSMVENVGMIIQETHETGIGIPSH